MQQLEEENCLPLSRTDDNGPEFISKKLAKWREKNHVEQKFIQPGRPMQNGYNERLKRTYREDFLDAYFDSLENTLIDQWKRLTPNQKRIWQKEEAIKEKELTVETDLPILQSKLLTS